MANETTENVVVEQAADVAVETSTEEIGRASCRERV